MFKYYVWCKHEHAPCKNVPLRIAFLWQLNFMTLMGLSKVCGESGYYDFLGYCRIYRVVLFFLRELQ